MVLLLKVTTKYAHSPTVANPPGGGGGGTLVCMGVHTLVINILRFEAPLFKKNRWLFPVKKTSLLLSKHWHWMNGNTYVDFIILCLFSGSRLGSPVTSGVTRRQSRGHFVDCKRFSTPPPPPNTSYLGTPAVTRNKRSSSEIRWLPIHQHLSPRSDYLHLLQGSCAVSTHCPCSDPTSHVRKLPVTWG